MQWQEEVNSTAPPQDGDARSPPGPIPVASLPVPLPVAVPVAVPLPLPLPDPHIRLTKSGSEQNQHLAGRPPVIGCRA